MRDRIKVKVDINAIGIELQEKELRRRELISGRLKDIVREYNISYKDAKKRLKNDLKWACMARQMRMIN